MISAEQAIATTGFSLPAQQISGGGRCELDFEVLDEMLKVACAAPSADNNQPWKFEAETSRLTVLHDQERQLSSDFNRMFDLMALGCAVENIVQQAAARGYRTRVNLSPLGASTPEQECDRIAELTWENAELIEHEGLANWIYDRETNRNSYSIQPLAGNESAELSKCVTQGVKLDWIEDRSHLASFANLIGESDKIRFMCRDCHEELHSQLRLNLPDVACTRDGLDYRTLGLPQGGRWFLRAIKSWSVAGVLNRLGLAKAMTLPGVQVVRQSAAIGLLSLDSSDQQAMFEGGRAFQRLWLTATKLGLSLQPLASLPMVLSNKELPEAASTLVGRVRASAKRQLPLGGRTLLMAFRIGYPKRTPHVRSLRRDFRESVTYETPSARGHKSLTGGETWTYKEAFKRNSGLISGELQEKLRRCRVAIPGMGGVGGVHLMTLARLGVGAFTIADADEFGVANFNRQYGASIQTVGDQKADTMSRIVQQVNPEVRLNVLKSFVTPKNVHRFLDGVDVLVDSVDFFSIDARRLLFAEARRRGIWAITAGPIGFSTAWMTFDPNGMSFEEYFAMASKKTKVDQLVSFAVGLTPQATQSKYMDLSKVDLNSGAAPSVGLACQLASGVAASEVVKILSGEGNLRSAPYFQQFDSRDVKLKKGKLRWGNRGPLQQIKQFVLKRICARNGVAN